jgi:hypothetical protein
MQHKWLHILDSATGACTLCCKYGGKAKSCYFGAELKTLDNHIKSDTHKSSLVLYNLDKKWLSQLAHAGALAAAAEKCEAEFQAAQVRIFFLCKCYKALKSNINSVEHSFLGNLLVPKTTDWQPSLANGVYAGRLAAVCHHVANSLPG